MQERDTVDRAEVERMIAAAIELAAARQEVMLQQRVEQPLRDLKGDFFRLMGDGNGRPGELYKMERRLDAAREATNRSVESVAADVADVKRAVESGNLESKRWSVNKTAFWGAVGVVAMAALSELCKVLFSTIVKHLGV